MQVALPKKQRQPRTPGAPRQLSAGEELLALHIRAVGLPAPVREYRFDEKRRWRLDFAWPAQRVAVEVEGVTASGGRHQRISGFRADTKKYNALVLRGWRLLRYLPSDVKAGTAVEEIKQLLTQEAPPWTDG
jgi:very-short-patch-repair endonuclease